jgi:hypothetical protein
MDAGLCVLRHCVGPDSGCNVGKYPQFSEEHANYRKAGTLGPRRRRGICFLLQLWGLLSQLLGILETGVPSSNPAALGSYRVDTVRDGLACGVKVPLAGTAKEACQ